MHWRFLALALLAASRLTAQIETGFHVSVDTYVTPTTTMVGYEVPAGENFAFYTGWEYGDDVELVAGAGVIANFNFEYYANYALTDGWTVRIYEKNPVTGWPGRQLDSRSGDILSGGAITRIQFGYHAENVLPSKFIYTLQFSGIGAGKAAGLIVPDRLPSIGASEPGFLINTARGWESASFNRDGSGDGDLKIVVPPAAPGGPIPLGQNVALTVGATGRGPLVFQWRWNGVVIPGATSAKLDLGALRAKQGGYYEVAVSDGTGVVFSDPVTVQPEVPVLPFTDGFSRAVSNGAVIEGLTGTGRGSNLLATAEVGEPAHGPLPANASLWLSWRPEASGVATFSTLGSDFDTVLAIYQQPPFGAKGFPGLVRIAANDQAVAFTHASEVQFNVIAGSTYLIVVDGKSSLDRGGRGRVMLSWDTELTPDRLPIASQSAPRVAVGPNEPVRMETQVSLPTGATAEIRWYRLMPDGALFSGVLGDSLQLPAINEAAVGRYYAEALVTYPNGNTRTVRVGLFDIQMRLGDNEGDQVLAWDTFSLSRANIPTQAGVANRSRIQRSGLSRGTSGTQVFSSVGSTREDGEPATCGVVGAATSWYALVAEADGPISVNTVGSNFDTVIAVYTDTGEGPGLFDGLRPVTCNDNASATVTTSAVQFCARAGTVYFIQVDGAGGAVGTVKLNFSMANDNSTCELAASECQQGMALHVLPSNGQLVLAPEILNQPPYTLEWMHEGQVIAGKKEPVLQLGEPQSGDYAMRLTSRFGQTVRPVAKVRTVNPGETGTGFVWLCDGRLRLLPAGAPNQTLVLERSADLSNWTPVQTNAPASGSFEFVVPGADQEQSAVYRVRPQ
jgi:hypothetical protein